MILGEQGHAISLDDRKVEQRGMLISYSLRSSSLHFLPRPFSWLIFRDL